MRSVAIVVLAALACSSCGLETVPSSQEAECSARPSEDPEGNERIMLQAKRNQANRTVMVSGDQQTPDMVVDDGSIRAAQKFGYGFVQQDQSIILGKVANPPGSNAKFEFRSDSSIRVPSAADLCLSFGQYEEPVALAICGEDDHPWPEQQFVVETNFLATSGNLIRSKSNPTLCLQSQSTYSGRGSLDAEMGYGCIIVMGTCGNPSGSYEQFRAHMPTTTTTTTTTTTITTTTTTTIMNYEQFAGDCFGDNIEVYDLKNMGVVSSIHECKQTCDNDAKCQGFSFATYASECITKWGVCTKTVQDGWIFYRKM